MERETFSKIAVLLSCILYSSSGLADNTEMIDVPESFRDLWGEQDELLEVKLYGQSLGIQRVKTTPTTVRIDSPDSLLDKIDINKEKETELRELLRRSFPRNGNLSCQGSSGQHGCNYIKTNSAAVIMDDVDNVLNLFIGSDFLASGEAGSDYYQLSRNTKKAFIHSQTVNLSDSGHYNSLSVSGLEPLELRRIVILFLIGMLITISQNIIHIMIIR